MPRGPLGQHQQDGEDDAYAFSEKDASVPRPLHQRSRRRWLWLAAIGLVVVAAAIAVPVGVVVSKNNNDKSSSSSNGGTGSGSGNGGGSGGGSGGSGGNLATTGGNGSTITTVDGSTFTYINNFGGFWVDDPNDPFNDNAQCNSWTPPLNTTWQWGTNKINGVNLGGWFVLEPFITPTLYQKYQNANPLAQDEWTLSQDMTADTSPGGGISQIEDHYNTFITEEDIAQIAGAGLNYVRVPMPFWAMNAWAGEPFLQQTSWKYILRFFGWARKYGIRVNIDLHTIPGSQNSFNHSGKDGQINFLLGIMGYANAQRALDYIRSIAEFITQPEYQNLVPLFSVINEPRVMDIGKPQISEFYFQVYTMLRGITGFGEGKGAFMVMHDGFQGTETWAGFFPGADRLILDTHPYFAFNGQPNDDPVEVWAPNACNSYGPGMLTSQTGFGVTIAGEWSNGYNDCAFYLNGVQNTHVFPGDCSPWEDASSWNASTIAGIKNYAMASMDALQNWYFWTWKIGNMTSGTIGAPLWSYQLGLQGGWIPADPREATGFCSSIGIADFSFTGTYAASATGGGDGVLAAAVTQSFGTWPPTDISSVDADITLVPTYTNTVSPYTLPPATFTPAPSKSVSEGDGWADAADTSGSVTTVSGCTYPDAWDSNAQTMPAAPCTGPAVAAPTVARMAVRAELTPVARV
ncbi:glycoside hydrolase [Schizopora paradoxa]|uniref:glucan 1,3-beta-glucosidase n=1 Tax=Schizopora paradoxa TaxID=27342 RepID=A0A0H2RKP5_9AGAM|nr:glycoside hydrolase [Schizopora paradoxa]